MTQIINTVVVVICVVEAVIVLPERHVALLEDPGDLLQMSFSLRQSNEDYPIAFKFILNYENNIYTYNNTNICTALSAEKKTFVYHLKYNDGLGKDSVERNYVLDVSDNKSIFRSISERKSDSLLSNGKYGFWK